MEKELKKLLVVGIVCLLVGMVLGGANKSSDTLGATVYNRAISFDEGILVDQTERISGTGGASFTTGAFSTTLTVTGETIADTVIEGGDVVSLTGTTTSPTAANVCDGSVWNYLADNSEGVASTTLPSESELIGDCLATVGQHETILFRNIAATGSTTEIVAGTDLTLMYTDGGNVTIDGGNAALITFWRIAASTTIAIVEELD